MPHIDTYFATLSPFTYLASQAFPRIVAQHGCTVTYKPLDIMALFDRTGGTRPAERHENRKDYRLQELRRQAKKRDLPLNLQPAHWPTNGAPAAYAIIAAQKAGGGDLHGLIHTILKACWADDRDIAEDEVIRDALTASGFDPALADGGMLSGAEEYAANLEQAVAAGAFGAPFYIVDGGEKFWGQDRLEDLDLYLSGKL